MNKLFSLVSAAALAVALPGAAHAEGPIAANTVRAEITLLPVDRVTGAPHVNSSYGEIRFFATDEKGNVFEPERGESSFVLTQKGRYRISGQSVYNFCYSDSTDIQVDEHTAAIQVRLFVSCE